MLYNLHRLVFNNNFETHCIKLSYQMNLEHSKLANDFFCYRLVSSRVLAFGILSSLLWSYLNMHMHCFVCQILMKLRERPTSSPVKTISSTPA